MAKIIVTTSRFPFPLEKGDKLRVYNQIKYLSKAHEVYLIAINDHEPNKQQIEALKPYCKEIKVFVIPLYQRIFNLLRRSWGTLPFQVSYFFSQSCKEQILKYINQIEPDAIYSHLIRTSEYVKDMIGFRKTLDYMDCFSKGFKLKLEKTKNPISKWIFNIEYKRLKIYEESIYKNFDNHCIISQQDRNTIPHPKKSKIEVIPNGVDFAIFYPMAKEKKFDILFSGNMGYQPNIDAAYFAATKILPIVLKQQPSIKMLIAGVNPPKQIKHLAGPNIEVIEKFTHIRDAFAQSKVNLVPVITSIGLQNKLLQAMAMKIPSVTTLSGAKGIHAENQDVVLIGNSAEEIAQHILNILEDMDLYNHLSEKAYRFVHKNFDWEEHNQKLLELILKKENENG